MRLDALTLTVRRRWWAPALLWAWRWALTAVWCISPALAERWLDRSAATVARWGFYLDPTA
jgi:hypothetical protein